MGRHLVERLLSDPKFLEAKLYVLMRDSSETLWRNPRVTILDGGFSDLSTHSSKIKGADYVFHLGANSSFGNGSDYEASNVEPLRKLVGILKESQNLKNFIFTSSIGAYDRSFFDFLALPISNQSKPNPRSAYGASKLEGERILKNSGLPFTLLRPAWIYGQGMRVKYHVSQFASMVNERSPLRYFAFPGKVSLVHVSDLVDVLVACTNKIEMKNKSYFVGFEDRSIGSVFKTLNFIIHGKSVKQIPVPSFRWLLGLLHPFFPLTVVNLFCDYLTCSSKELLEDMGKRDIKKFADYGKDLVESHAKVSGYIVITGGNSGIGLALCKLFEKLGRRLLIIDRKVDTLKDCFGPEHMIVEADLSRTEDLEHCVEQMKKVPLAGLVNNAGVGYKGLTTDLDWDKLKATLDINCAAPVYFVNHLGKKLRREGSFVVNIASSVSYFPLPYMSVYGASKSFLLHWSLGLSEEMKGTNPVLTYSPSGTNTRFQSQAGVANKGGQGLLTPEEVARSILQQLTKKKRHYLGGLKGRILVAAFTVMPYGLRTKVAGILFKSMR